MKQKDKLKIKLPMNLQIEKDIEGYLVTDNITLCYGAGKSYFDAIEDWESSVAEYIEYSKKQDGRDPSRSEYNLRELRRVEKTIELNNSQKVEVE
jgi:hypothetical protein